MVNLLGRAGGCLPSWLVLAVRGQPVPHASRPSSCLAGEVDPTVLSAAEGETEFLVYLRASRFERRWLAAKFEKGAMSTTPSPARRTQAGTFIAALQGAPYQAFWVTNLLWVRGDLRLAILGGSSRGGACIRQSGGAADIPEAAAPQISQYPRKVWSGIS